MKPWSEFYPFVLTEVIGCPYPTVDHHLRLAARDFCERTAAWREWSDPFRADGSAHRFAFDLDSQADLVRAIRATVDGEELRILSSAALPPRWQTAETASADAPADALVPIDRTEYLLYPRPAAGAEVALLLALKPSIHAAVCGDVLADAYAEAIAHGALGRLLAMPRTDFLDPGRAADCRMQYERAVHLAANADFRLAAPGQRRVQPLP